MDNGYIIGIGICILYAFTGCSSKETTIAWEQTFYQIGSQSSPRAVDLNQDGVLDIVMGAGKSEIGYTDQGVIALNGVSGELLWQHEANASMVGSATFYDITGDRIPDVIIGGRKAQLVALNGEDGKLIWQYDYQYENDSILQYARYNFYNNQLIPDINENGYPELLTINGGNWDSQPGDTSDRYPGVLMVLDSKNGAILAADTMPDGKESYMSPIYFHQKDQEDATLLFGTGGETISGNLYQIALKTFLQSGLALAEPLITEQQHGFIAPPSVVDLTQDGYYDLVAISHASKVSAIDGKTKELLWERKFEGMETSNGMGVGYFTHDKVPDVFAYISKGTWPLYTGSTQIILDGKTGETVFSDSLGCTSMSSPVVYDMDRDGYDEALFSTNQYDCTLENLSDDQRFPTMESSLMLVDLEPYQVNVVEEVQRFSNLYSTPWIGDMDNDGYLDIVMCQYFHSGQLYRFVGMKIKRVSSAIPVKKAPIWGAYMGSDGRNVFPLE